jgi:hypothetical protein
VAPPTDAELAESIVLEPGFFGADWEEVVDDDDDSFDYSTITGCEFMDVLRDDDGSLVEAESVEFSQFDTTVQHDVRVYPDPETAIDVVAAWTQQAVLDCLVAGAETEGQAAFDAGVMEPFTAADFNITRYDDIVGEPRLTNFEIVTTLSGPDLEQVLLLDVWFMQVGRSVSRLEFQNPDAVWEPSTDVLDIVFERMVAADAADSAAG